MKKTASALMLFFLPLIAFAWNGNGHGTGGAIAYYYLKSKHPATIPKVIAILKQHPWLSTSRWSDKLAGLTDEQKEVALFMLASTYPDDAKNNPPTEGGVKKKWHYVDYPYSPDGTKGQNPPSPNAEEKIPELVKAFGSETDPAKKAVDLCWLFHLIEDIHQPLHAASLFDKNHLSGDGGGNDTYISFPTSTNAVVLHSFWDGLIKGSFKNNPQNAQALLGKYPENSLNELTQHLSVHDWITKESFPLAQSAAYKNGAVVGTKDNPSPAPANYADDSKKIAERRIVLAGIRLAKQLQDIVH